MPLPTLRERFSGAINQVTIGATPQEGGTRKRKVTIGGGAGLPILRAEAELPNRPVFALEVSNAGVGGWLEEAKRHVKGVAGDLGQWAASCEQSGADLVCLRLRAAHPDEGGRSADDCAGDVKRVLEHCGLPLIIWGVDVPEVDNVVLPKCAQAARGENCLLGTAKEKDYRTLAAACLADGHKIISEAPCDINLAKQVNILLQDMGTPLGNIVMHPTTSALGFGMIYVYSLMERARLAALGGDKLLQQPFLLNVGEEAGRVKEARASEEEEPRWGALRVRSPLWEAATVIDLMAAGGELFILRNPEALMQAKEALARLWPEKN
jgi:acetyl-CoA decarbonylase/synthase complex subunit delta